jgi:hypothetical protein
LSSRPKRSVVEDLLFSSGISSSHTPAKARRMAAEKLGSSPTHHENVILSEAPHRFIA